MRSLNVGVNQSVVAVPIGLTGDPPAGDPDSINQDQLDGRDFGVAISSQPILARIQAALDELQRSFVYRTGITHRTYLDLGFLGDVDVLNVRIDWTITLKSAKAQWFGGTLPFMGVSAGVVMVTIAGQARTQKPIFNWDFDVTQMVMLTFDAGGERFVAAPLGTPGINFHLLFGAVVEAFAKPHIEAQVLARVKDAVAQLADGLDVKGRKTEIVGAARYAGRGSGCAFRRGRLYLRRDRRSREDFPVAAARARAHLRHDARTGRLQRI